MCHLLPQVLVLYFLVHSAALAQPQVLLADWGYRSPTAVAAAPGQIIVVSLYGLPARPLDAFHVYDSSGNYSTLNSGIAVMLIQSTEPKQLPAAVYAVQQTECSSADVACNPLTVLTLRLPFELQVPAVPGKTCPIGTACGNGSATLLRVFDQGVAAGDIPVQPVTDNIHFLNSCDQTRFTVPADTLRTCGPFVQHPNGQLVTKDNPAQPAETLMAWAYGLGTTTPLPPSTPNVIFIGPQLTILEGPVMQTSQTFDIGFALEPNIGQGRPVPSLGIAHPLFAGLRDAVGVFQVDILLPETLPQGRFTPCDGVQVLTNFVITLAGANSIDGAAICVSN